MMRKIKINTVIKPIFFCLLSIASFNTMCQDATSGAKDNNDVKLNINQFKVEVADLHNNIVSTETKYGKPGAVLTFSWSLNIDCASPEGPVEGSMKVKVKGSKQKVYTGCNEDQIKATNASKSAIKARQNAEENSELTRFGDGTILDDRGFGIRLGDSTVLNPDNSESNQPTLIPTLGF